MVPLLLPGPGTWRINCKLQNNSQLGADLLVEHPVIPGGSLLTLSWLVTFLIQLFAIQALKVLFKIHYYEWLKKLGSPS